MNLTSFPSHPPHFLHLPKTYLSPSLPFTTHTHTHYNLTSRTIHLTTSPHNLTTLITSAATLSLPHTGASDA
ncbi:hypothetical protein E2C01_101346 [Portunus trituberculatus]|uniref:Uncharacterized protein n=1 Tax=Portunus trituberculatus TaxID=210409 RepID=A0A5B7KLR6_PORTR|nr:hypothetical protein [Portunus trituberculatus]